MFKSLLLLSGSAAAALSGAQTLLALLGDTNGLAIDFATDQSIQITDAGTPANNTTSSGTVSAGALVGPGSKLTYASPSPKLCLQSTGYYAYGEHNLYLNSASPANQSITVISGTQYTIVITGSVSITWSGAYVGTTTVGTTTFTAASGTLTGGSTSGSGTVQVSAYPVVSGYISTGGSAIFSLPYEWNSSAVCQGVLVEEARTNLALYSNDFTNAAWTKSNCTTALTATGPDNVANSASTLTASAGNATALQAITSGSAARVTSVFLKRRTGSGNIQLTQDNGGTWTTQSITNAWVRYSLASVTSANPTVGIRIVTNGDAVDVAYFDHEVGAAISSPIITASASVTRAADSIAIATSAFPWGASLQTAYASVSQPGPADYHALLATSVDGDDLIRSNNSTTQAGSWLDAYGVTATAGSGSFAPGKVAIAWDGSSAAMCFNAGTVGTASGTAGLGAVTSVTIGCRLTGAITLNGYVKAVLLLPRKATNGELGTLTT